MTTVDGTPADTAARARLAGLALHLIPGVGPRTRRSLLEFFGSPEAVLHASAEQLRQVPGVGPKLAAVVAAGEGTLPGASRRKSTAAGSPWEVAAAEAELCLAEGLRWHLEDDPEYPARLRTVPDPPGVLFSRGTLLPQDGAAVAIVGSRHATRYGLTQAHRLAAGLAQAGYTVISGLARGIDAAAHRGALAAGGRTIAVLGSGLGRIYPPEHVDLAAEVAASGALLSEHPARFGPLASSFPQRNRIVSGMSLGVIVVEAALRSGALGTVQHALEQGREVFAVPGPIDSPLSQGCHRLIREGAKLVECVEDVVDELRTLAATQPPVPKGPRSLFDLLPQNAAPAAGPATAAAVNMPQLSETESKVYGLISSEPRRVDDVIAEAELPSHRVLAAIGSLEMRFLIRRVEGNRVERK